MLDHVGLSEADKQFPLWDRVTNERARVAVCVIPFAITEVTMPARVRQPLSAKVRRIFDQLS